MLVVIAFLVVFFNTSFNIEDRSFTTYQGPKKNLHIYLLIGQSNMAGRADYTSEDSDAIPRSYLLDQQNEWVPAKNPLNIYSSIRGELSKQKLGPGYTFVKTMLEKDCTISIGLVVNAKGGSNITEWDRGDSFYEEAVRRTRVAMKTGTLKGILWHQGESDISRRDYLYGLISLVSHLRKDLRTPDLPFIAGQIYEREEQSQETKQLNAQIAELPLHLPHTSFATSQGLTTLDDWHFDSASTKILGIRYANALIKLNNEPDI